MQKDIGIMKRALIGLSFLALLSIAVFGQSATTSTAFQVVDIHTSPRTTFPFFQGGTLRGDRYVMRNATMVDLIATAYGVDNDKVVGGPSWLETDRFDVIAKTPPATTQDSIKPMLQAMLAERFKLVVHPDTRQMSVYALTVGKGGKPKLKEADASGATGCQPPANQQPPVPGQPFYLTLQCRNMSMEVFAKQVRQFAGGYLTGSVVDQTGLKGSWDFEFKWTPRGQFGQAGPDGISIFDALDKQLGLKLDPQKIPLPVFVVDSANEKPTDNPPEVAAALPPAPPAEFEVAVIKPSPAGATPGGRFDPPGRIDLQAVTLKTLITLAWDLNPNNNDLLAGAPKWLDSDKFDIVAKISTAAPAPGAALPDIEDLRAMLRALLIDRFKMVVHKEDRPVNAYTLTAANPKMKKADPLNRTGCKEGPGPDGKDPRIANPILSRLMTCQNMTMAQFADQLRLIAGGYIFSPVQDATGLEGAWDFTLSFSPANAVNGGGRGASLNGNTGPPAGDVPTASDPTGALSIFDAVNKQLGLKLELKKRPVSVLVIDHVEEKPTDN
jgi:uncharacterized protein (TIGR03435 family)